MHMQRVSEQLQRVDTGLVDIFATLIATKIFLEGRGLFVCGNGGSFSIASHFTTDLSKIGIDLGKKCKIFCLGSNNSLLTAISNDYNYSSIFSKELSNLGNSGDVLFAISSSGLSPNILACVETSSSLGMTTMSLVGFKDSKVSECSDFTIDLKLKPGDYEIAEDVHSSICHSISLLIRESLLLHPKR